MHWVRLLHLEDKGSHLIHYIQHKSNCWNAASSTLYCWNAASSNLYCGNAASLFFESLPSNLFAPFSSFFFKQFSAIKTVQLSTIQHFQGFPAINKSIFIIFFTWFSNGDFCQILLNFFNFQILLVLQYFSYSHNLNFKMLTKP